MTLFIFRTQVRWNTVNWCKFAAVKDQHSLPYSKILRTRHMYIRPLIWELKCFLERTGRRAPNALVAFAIRFSTSPLQLKLLVMTEPKYTAYSMHLSPPSVTLKLLVSPTEITNYNTLPSVSNKEETQCNETTTQPTTQVASQCSKQQMRKQHMNVA